jgi:hypothetical protein
VSKETYYSVKRDLLQPNLVAGVATPDMHANVPVHMGTVSKETYYSVKRDLLYMLDMHANVPVHMGVLYMDVLTIHVQNAFSVYMCSLFTCVPCIYVFSVYRCSLTSRICTPM